MSDTPNTEAEANAYASTSTEEAPARKERGKSPPMHVWLTAIIFVVIVAAIRPLAFYIDGAIVNLISYCLIFIAAVHAFIWFCFFSGNAKRLRLSVLAGVVAFVCVLFSVFEIQGVRGDMGLEFGVRPWVASLFGGNSSNAPVADGATADLSTTTTRDYPQFLGPGGNAVVAEVLLEKDWQAHPPKELWRIPMGDGWSSFAVVNGFAVTMEQHGNEERITCYNVESGKLVWSHAVKGRHQTIMGGIGPRSTPTIADGKVYALGAAGVLTCLEGSNGEEEWTVNVLKEFGMNTPGDDTGVAWGRSASPLIVDDLVIVPPGGPGGGPYTSLVAYNKQTGKQVWKGGAQQVSYSSPVLATLAEQRQILIVNESTLAGHDPKTGKELWSEEWSGSSTSAANTSQPVAVGEDRVFISKGYGQGAKLLRVMKSDEGSWQTETLWENSRVLRTKFTNVAVYQDSVFGLSDGILECADLTTGDRDWKKGRYNHGQVLIVGDALLVIAELGELIMLEPTPEAHQELGEIQALTGKTWNNPALYGDLLLLRNGEEAVCYRLTTR